MNEILNSGPNTMKLRKLTIKRLLNSLAKLSIEVTVEPQYQKGLRDWQNMFAIEVSLY